jgi:hypothetical protein
MVIKNRVGAVTSALSVPVVVAGVLLGVAGCAAATAKPPDLAQAAQSVDEARVTGYASTNVTEPSGAGPTGAVSVVLHGASAAHIDQLINGLQKYTGSGCMESVQLYQIDFNHVGGGKQGFDVAGYDCEALVSITSDGKTVTLTDVNCALLSAVRHLLPATAIATQRTTPPPCVS